MKLYNDLTRQKEEFVPLKQGEVSIYSCGPTVYNYFHIGNARPFIVFDCLRRYLAYRGYKADVHPKATETMDEIIDMVKTLVEKGYAYESNGDVYFRTLRFKDYGKLSHQPIEELQAGARIDVSEHKENALDFALWKASKPGEPAWDSPWGPRLRSRRRQTGVSLPTTGCTTATSMSTIRR